MTRIKRGNINIRDIKEGDTLNHTVLTNYDLTNKSVIAYVKPEQDSRYR